MIKSIIIACILSIAFVNNSSAEVELKRIADCYLYSTSVDKQLKSNEAVFEFKLQFPNFQTNLNYNLIYSIDGASSNKVITKENSLVLKTTPGKHIFQFYLNENYYEIYTDSLLIEPKHRNVYHLYFMEAEEYPVMIEKPVIYVYPEQKMDVSLSLNIHGKDPFYYPAYKNGWKFSADPSGILTMDDKTYNYLFWDAQQAPAIKRIPESGFYVAKENVVQFLEEKLTQIGLTSKEQADFITYWGPRLTRNKLNMIHFMFDEECDQFAEISVSPKPNNVYRVYMVWSGVTAAGKIRQQELPTFDRSGFHVIEWGGQEVKL